MFSLTSGTLYRVVAVVGLAFALGCDEPLAPSAASVPELQDDRAAAAEAGRVVVMTRNVYVGAPVELLFSEDLSLPDAAAALWQHVQATDYPERAAALADEIAAARPHLVGLQEVSRFVIARPGVGVVETLDFQQVLLAALADRGLTYSAVSTSENFEGTVPITDPVSPIGVSFISLGDFDVIIARSGVSTSNPIDANFTVNFQAPIPGVGPFTVVRGWASVLATVEGLAFRFVTTHLEPGELVPDVQLAQAGELLAALEGEPHPVILVGDMNSDGVTTPTLNHLLAAGFVDAWGDRGAGATCCQRADLRNRRSILDRRFDLILMRGDFGLLEPGFRGAVHARIVGNKRADLTPSGLWPSDHAGVYARIARPRRPSSR